MTAQRPAYVPQGLVGAPIDFKWSGAGHHIGPVQTKNALYDQIGGVTLCGQLSLLAGLLEWGAWRLSGHTPVEHNLHLAKAVFAYQVDWRYVDRNAVKGGKLLDDPPALSAMMELNWMTRHALSKDDYWLNYYKPVDDTFHSAHLVRHILPATQRKAFQKWFDATTARLHEAAAAPKGPFRKKKDFKSEKQWEEWVTPHRGEPLPPSILDPEAEYKAKNRDAMVAEALAGMDWKDNPYLRSPADMRKLDFEGTPYKLG